MQIKQCSPQQLTLVHTSWWGLLVGLITAALCFYIEPAQMTPYPGLNKSILVVVGVFFFSVFTLAMKKTRVDFDSSNGTISLTTAPLLSLGKLAFLDPRHETRPLKPVLFAYAEKQQKTSHTAKTYYCLALATGVIPDEILSAKSAFTFAPEMDKVRWLIGHNVGMQKSHADEIVSAVNQWLGTKLPTPAKSP